MQRPANSDDVHWLVEEKRRERDVEGFTEDQQVRFVKFVSFFLSSLSLVCGGVW